MKNIYVEVACPGCSNQRSVRKGREVSLCRPCYLERLKNEVGHNWKGGEYIADGRVFIWKPEHPYAQKHGYILRSHLVMEAIIGRPVLPGENIHHINGILDDDRKGNLALMSWGKHTGLHNHILNKAKHMGKFRWPEVLENEWKGEGVPSIGATTRGHILGHKRNAIYEFIICPQCQKARWASRSNLKRAHSLLCHLCTSLSKITAYNKQRIRYG